MQPLLMLDEYLCVTAVVLHRKDLYKGPKNTTSDIKHSVSKVWTADRRRLT